ncbi:hypothetical protein D3OALGA1CA_5801 [Olavius algarvensis associated proteobacterium Delta 3]|nr:hypothetical protein D3OALGB2SA_1228 [Olavius algarvensis associated proteobacterium Delta 3]CAB5172029.1 hypothetical protein D3OALGA1CA_5801 [Olavius algarvensis associated proteobacterium Delta 3]
MERHLHITYSMEDTVASCALAGNRVMQNRSSGVAPV